MKKSTLSFALILFSFTNLYSQSWTQQNLNFKNIGSGPLKISIADANTAWCVSSYFLNTHEFSRTTDGGNTWVTDTIDSLPQRSAFTGIAAIDSVNAFICVDLYGLGGAVFKTIDGGATWNRLGTNVLFTDSNSYPNEIYFWDAANGIVFGDPIDVGGINEIYLTSDSGKSWSQVSAPNIPPGSGGTFMNYGPMVVIDSTIWFQTYSGYIFKSIDRGHYWTKTVINTAIGSIFSLCFLDDKIHGLAIANGNTPLETTDGGNTWSLFTPTGVGPWSLTRAIPGTNYYVSVQDNGTHSSYSPDYGHTWIPFDSVTSHSCLAFKDINTGFAGSKPISTTEGGIYKWDAGIVGINPPVTNNQNTIFPNPVTTELTIRSSQKMDEIRILDLLGKQLLSLKIHSLEIPINVNNLHTGIYLIQIISDDKISVQKFIKQ